MGKKRKKPSAFEIIDLILKGDHRNRRFNISFETLANGGGAERLPSFLNFKTLVRKKQ